MRNALKKVLSFDASRVKLTNYKNRRAVSKHTSKVEFQQIQAVRAHLIDKLPKRECLKLWNIQTAPILNWSEKRAILTTRYCSGTNSETLLKDTLTSGNQSQRNALLYILHQFIFLLREIGLLWGDLAPRNIIINLAKRQIRLVDFERPLVLQHRKTNSLFFSRFLRGYAKEEFSSHLTRQEQKQFFNGLIYNDDRPKERYLSEIKSKRMGALLHELFGENNSYTGDQIRIVENLMANIATPFSIGNKYFFPSEIVDQISSRKGAKEYANIARQLCRRNRRARYILLRRNNLRYSQ